MPDLQRFINKYSNKKYPHQISESKLMKIFERIGQNYLSDSLFKDFIKTQKLRGEACIDPEFLNSLQRIIDTHYKK